MVRSDRTYVLYRGSAAQVRELEFYTGLRGPRLAGGLAVHQYRLADGRQPILIPIDSKNLVGRSPPIIAKMKSLGMVTFSSLVLAFIKTTSASRISLIAV